MAYDEGLAQRIRERLEERADVVEKHLFGGVCWLVRGNMACGVVDERMIVRVGPEEHPRSSALPHTRPFDYTGRPMKGWLMVEAEGYAADDDLEAWIEKGTTFASTLPAK